MCQNSILLDKWLRVTYGTYCMLFALLFGIVLKFLTMKKNDKRLTKILHPKGRKTVQLTKKVIKSTARQKTKLLHHMKQNLLGEKLIWFRNNLTSIKLCTPKIAFDLIDRYLKRFDNELKHIQMKHAIGKRKKRQHATREDTIKMTIEHERNEFVTCGLEIPNVFNFEELKLLKNWSGELRFLQNFNLVRYTQAQLENLLKKPVKSSGNH